VCIFFFFYLFWNLLSVGCSLAKKLDCSSPMILVLFFLILELKMSLTPEQQSLTSPFPPLFHFMNDDFIHTSPWMQHFPDEFIGLLRFGSIHIHQHLPATLVCSCTCHGHRNWLINHSVVQESWSSIVWWGTQTLYFYKPSKKKCLRKSLKSSRSDSCTPFVIRGKIPSLSLDFVISETWIISPQIVVWIQWVANSTWHVVGKC